MTDTDGLRKLAEKTDAKTAEALRWAADEITRWGVLHDERMSQLRAAGRELDELRSAAREVVKAIDQIEGDYATLGHANEAVFPLRALVSDTEDMTGG